jgi:hypothetical protein
MHIPAGDLVAGKRVFFSVTGSKYRPSRPSRRKTAIILSHLRQDSGLCLGHLASPHRCHSTRSIPLFSQAVRPEACSADCVATHHLHAREVVARTKDLGAHLVLAALVSALLALLLFLFAQKL